MHNKFLHGSLWLTLALACSGLHAQRADETAEIPEKCAPYLDTVERCQRFEMLSGHSGWKVEYQKSFSANATLDDVKIEAPAIEAPEKLKPPLLQLVKEEGGVLRVNSHQFEQALVQIGPRVAGEYALQMKIRCVAGQPCDLSFIHDSAGKAPAFQFGGYVNTRNRLNLGDDENGRRVVLDEPVKEGAQIVMNQWHTVRFEVTKKAFIGYVDGKVVLQGKPTASYDFTVLRKPLIYVYQSSAEIADYRVERIAQNADEEVLAKAWKEAFVEKTRDQAVSDLEKLTALLADSDFATRQGADDLLARAGRLAIEPLQAASKSGALEKRERAKSLLLKLGVTPAPAE